MFRVFTRAHVAAILGSPTCPLIGYAPPRAQDVTSADVATPVTVQIGKMIPDCGPTRRGHCFCGWPEVQVCISFKARAAVTSVDSHYEVNMAFTSTGHCSHGYPGGQSGPTATNLRAGQLVRMSMPVTACRGIIHGDVVYDSSQPRIPPREAARHARLQRRRARRRLPVPRTLTRHARALRARSPRTLRTARRRTRSPCRLMPSRC